MTDLGPVDEPVFRVVRLVSTSSESWEDATRRGVIEAAKSNPGLTTARVLETDTLIVEGGGVRYRLRLELAVRVDRERSEHECLGQQRATVGRLRGGRGPDRPVEPRSC